MRKNTLKSVSKAVGKSLASEKALKTYGWAVMSGIIFGVSGLIAGAEMAAVVKATSVAVALKSPAYWAYEIAWAWGFSK
jgi:hypothetical protein